jgi:CDP-glycerol glycerophosphotransferase
MTDPGELAAPDGPEISVVIPVHNAMPYLTECLDSVRHQTFGHDRLEVVAVDDASSDGSGAELDRYAKVFGQLRVVHREVASGGPSTPRNEGLARAGGRYVFFLDADDVLGTDALRRMVAMAEEHGSELVVGRTVGLGGRSVTTRAFRHEPRADLSRSEVIRSCAPHKLFRRTLLDRERLRFDTGFWYGEDQIFVTQAYLAAAGISVVGDYDCYYLRARADGGNLVDRWRGVEERVGHIERVMAIIAERAADPVVRRRMLGRNFRSLADTALLPGLLELGAEDREKLWSRCRKLYQTRWSAGIAPEVAARQLVALRCLADDRRELAEALAAHSPRPDRRDDVIERGRVYRAFPGFRVPDGLPDSVYDVTDRLAARAMLESAGWSGDTLVVSGHGYIDWVDSAGSRTRLLLRHRRTGREVDLPTAPQPSPGLAAGRGHARDYGSAGWRAVIDPSALAAGGTPPGVWDAFVRISAQGVVKERRLPAPREPAGVPLGGARFLGLGANGGAEPTAVVPYATKNHWFSVDVGGTLRPVVSGAVVGGVRWDGALLQLSGLAGATEVAAADLTAELVLCPRAGPGAQQPAASARTGRPFLRSRLTRRRPAPRPESPGPVVIPVPLTPQPVPVAADGADGLPAGVIALAFRVAVDPGPLSGGLWDLHLRLRLPGRRPDIRLRPAPAAARTELWRTRLWRAAGRTGCCTPYLTKGGYLVLDTGPVHFSPTTQLLLCPPAPAADGTGDFVVRGRVGVTGHGVDDLRCEVLRDGERVHGETVTLAAATDEDPLPAAVGRERGAEHWPAFSQRIPGRALAGDGGSWSARLCLPGSGFAREIPFRR